jgi:hypothetical protein
MYRPVYTCVFHLKYVTKTLQICAYFFSLAYVFVELLACVKQMGPNELECNIKLGWRALPGTNTLAYQPHL